MRSILIVNPKGGCGKSTLAMNIAAFFALRGDKVALADCDPQGCSTDWLAARPPDRSVIHMARVSAGRVETPHGTQVVVIDAQAATHGARLASLFGLAQTAIVPILPSPLDMRAAERFIGELMEVRKVSRHRIVLGTVANRVREDTLAAIKLENYLEHLRLPDGRRLRYLAILRNSQNYVHAAERGLSIFELAPSATYYDREQWQPLLRWLMSERSVP
jgi:chromosome partitioning protein